MRRLRERGGDEATIFGAMAADRPASQRLAGRAGPGGRDAWYGPFPGWLRVAHILESIGRGAGATK